MNEIPIKAVFTVTREEYLRAVRRHYKTNIHVYRDISIGLAAIVAGIGMYFWNGIQLYSWVLIIPGLILLLLVAYAFLMLPKLIYHSDPKLKWEYSLSFYDDRIEFRTNEIESILKWQLYRAWLRDDEFYILYHGKRNISVIPRRAFDSDGSDNRLTKLLERKLGPPGSG